MSHFSIREIKKELILLIICISLLILINYNYLDSELEDFLFQPQSKTIEVSRVIDGDTIVYEREGNETSVRLLGINTPEEGERFYSEAKKFLESRILNKPVKLIYNEEKHDMYGRELAYVFYKNKNLNLMLIEEGLANHYFPSGKDSHYSDFLKAWERCVNKEKGLCKGSEDKCSGCIELKKADNVEQKVVFYNSCNFECNLTNWTIKDEGRKKFNFQGFVLDPKKEVEIRVGEGTSKEGLLFWEDESYVWTSSGDTLFLRDSEGDLVLWEKVS